MSADNHWGQEAKSLPKQAGYMTAMISSQIDDQMSCKRGGSIYGASAGNCLQQFRPRQLRCSSVGRNCCRQLCDTPAVPGGRSQLFPTIVRHSRRPWRSNTAEYPPSSRLAGAALQHPRCCILYFDPGPYSLSLPITRGWQMTRGVNAKRRWR